jgi:hypothetical protein
MGPRIFRNLMFFSGGIFLFCMACARPPAPVSFPPPHEASREQIIEAIKKKTFDFLSLKSLAKVKIEYPHGDKTKKQSFDGALLYKDSGEFRFQGFGFFGRTLFDLLYKPNDLILYIPSDSIAYQGVPNPLPDFKDGDVFSVARKIITGIGETYDHATFHFSRDVYSPYIDNGNGHHLLFKINPRNLLIDKKIVLQDGKTTAEIDYQDYEQFGQKFFPTRITVFLPLQQTTIAFHFESPTVNQALPDNLFTLSLPSHVERRPLSELPIDFPATPVT